MWKVSKLMVDTFQSEMMKTFYAYCEHHNLEGNNNDFMVYLIDREIIKEPSIRKFVVRREFRQLLPGNDYQKTKTVRSIAEKFMLSERTIWGIIKE